MLQHLLRRDKGMKIKKRWYALFTAPLMITFFVVVIIPFFIGIGYSFVEWDGFAKHAANFVGMSNYKAVFGDKQFINAAVRTTIFTVISVITVNVLGLFFALLVTTGLKVKNFARTMLFFIFMMVVVTTWQLAGYVMIVYITGIMAIPDDVMEAAAIDGANYFQTLLSIKFPLLMPSFTICLFLALSNCFKIYDVNVSLTGEGANFQSEMFSLNIYNEIFSLSNFGYGQAKAIIFFLIIAIVTFIQVSITKKREVAL